MKFFLVLLALSSAALAAPKSNTKALQDDLDEFKALIPTEAIIAKIQEYADVDPDVQRIITYLQGQEWQDLVASVAAMPEYQALKAELLAAGLDIDGFIADIHDMIGSIVVPPTTGKGARTVQELVDEIKALIPTADIIVLLNDKLTNSPEFIAFWERVTSADTFALVEQVRALDEVQRLAAVLLEMGYDVTAALDSIYEFLGWPPAKTRALQDDLDEFLALIPIEEITTVVQNHANTDADVQQIITYLQGPEWQALIASVAAMPEYQALKAELLAAGLDIDGLIGRIHDLINSIVVPPTAVKGTKTVQEMLDEIMALIPLADLIVLLNDKLTNSPEFIAFWERVTSAETFALVEQVRALEEVQRLAAVLLEMGIDVTAILDSIYEFLGWPPAKSRALQDDLDEFLALIPIEEITTVVQNHANTDADVQQIITYLQGPEWQALIASVAAMPEYQALKAELLAAGLDIDGLIGRIHDLINSIVVPPTAVKGTRTVQEMLDEIMALIPLADLIVLLNDKLTNSPEFIAFWERVTSAETFALVEQVRALEEVQRLAAVLLEMGIDVTAILDSIYEFLGWPPAKSRALQDDLNEFLALIPIEEITAVVQNHANTDADVQQIITYLQGAEWQALIASVAAMPEYQALKAELLAAGLDIDGLIGRIHDLINSIVVPPTAVKGTRTVKEMLDEIMALIPLADMIVLLNDKLTNSPEFIAFWERVTSAETFELVETVRALEEVQRLAAVLLEMGIDATAILDSIYEFLGWPPAKF